MTTATVYRPVGTIADRLREAAAAKEASALQAYRQLVRDIAADNPIDDATAANILADASKSPADLEAAVSRAIEAVKVRALMATFEAQVAALPQARRDLIAADAELDGLKAAYVEKTAPIRARIHAGETATMRLISERNRLSLLDR